MATYQTMQSNFPNKCKTCGARVKKGQTIYKVNGAWQCCTGEIRPLCEPFRSWEFSREQELIREHFNNSNRNLRVLAGPGCGKTSTSLAILELPEIQDLYSGIFMLSYGRELTDETASMAEKHGIKCTVKTVHSFGFNSLFQYLKVYPQANKYHHANIAENLLPFPEDCEDDFKQIILNMRQRLTELIEACKAWALKGTPEDVSFLCSKYGWVVDYELAGLLPVALLQAFSAILHLDPTLYHETIDNYIKYGKPKQDKHKMGQIHFDDMIYLPVMLGLPLKDDKINLCVLDEVQDFTYCMGRLILMLYKQFSCKIVMIGDKYQSIYGFRYADTDSMDTLGKMLDCDDLTLSITRRCSKAVVARALTVIPECGLIAHEDNAVGEDAVVSWDDMLNRVTHGDAILCRVNFPLVALAFELLAMGKKASISGKGDIEDRIMALIKRVKAKKNKVTDLVSFDLALEKEKQKDLDKLAKRKAGKMAHGLLDDLYKSLGVIIANVSSLAEIESKLASIFNGSGIILSTGHKAKGKEWRDVYHIFTDKFPSKYAETEEELKQERNLLYVLVTRAKNGIFDVSNPPKPT